MDACGILAIMPGRLESVNVSGGGVPKTSVFEALVTEQGVDGDRQADPRVHGGPDRAVVLFSADVIAALRAEGHPIAAGTTGENLTVSGIDWAALAPGMTVAVGGVHLFITKYAMPCYKIAGSFVGAEYRRIDHREHPGFSRLCARVVEAGIVRPGDPVSILRSPTEPVLP
jgi:MOSC domain-containing protein YiiM